ncbi:MAG: BMP family ABC transporter substrate-binding protein, partial [Acholeplasmataceae bacterium]|nr:BMP family ABC transporter substrate-binding protein [Acholeplasmataceae bacterium]
GQSVMAAAASADKKVIGVDVDQSYDSPTVITSATKNLSQSVIQALEAIYETGRWESDFGGVSATLDAAADGIGLPMANSKFETFTNADYQAIFNKLVDGTQEVSNVIGEFGDDGSAAEQFETAEVKVNVIPFE